MDMMNTNQNFMTIDEFEIGKYLGSGQFGDVFLTRHKPTSYIVALKILDKSKIKTPEFAKQLRRELEIHLNLKHSNILAMYGYFYDSLNIYMVLEYAMGGEMFAKLQTSRKFNEITACKYIFQVAKGIYYMQHCGVIHRDIKPENILIGTDNTIKLCDFGWAVKNVDERRYTFCGTKEYLAPEMLMKKKHCVYLDMWCLGILTYEFLTGKTPFSQVKDNEYRSKVTELNYMMPPFISEKAKDFIKKLLVKEPEKRLKICDLPNHPWIESNIDDLERENFYEI